MTSQSGTTRNRYSFRPWTMPVALLALSLLSFGLLIPALGFFWDDWPVILTGKLQGARGFWQFYQYDRPISAWTYILTFPVLGTRPIHWHIFTLLLRWGTAFGLWWTLSRLWPCNRREVNRVALLFLVYPVFTQQPISVAYSQHWICYLLFFVSMGAMVQAYRVWNTGRLRSAILTGLALVTSLLHLVTMEYFAGLELLRPFLLWLLISEQPGTQRSRAIAVLRGWLPYLMVLGAFVIWRLFFLEFPGEDANPPILLMNLLSDPVSAGLRFVEIAVQDTLHLLVSVWANILAPANINLRDRFTLFSWFWTGLVALLAVLFLVRQERNAPGAGQPGIPWSRQALGVGLVAIALGMLPVWFTDRQIIVGTYSSRFGLAAMFGSSLVLVAILDQLIKRDAQRIVLIGMLIGLAAGLHLRIANDFRWSWVAQTRFYWHLYWRAPAIQPGTAILSDGEIFKWVGLYSTSAGINLLYPTPEPSSQLNYYFYSLGRDFKHSMKELKEGAPLEKVFRHYTFTGHTKDALVIYYDPSEHDCLEVLTAIDANAPDIPEVTREALGNSNLSRILPEPVTAPPPSDIFGPEPERGWCYLYEKAALAAQQGKWQEAASLADQARQQGYFPDKSDSNTPIEWIPMIEAYARMGRWGEAEELSMAAYYKDQRIDARLCNLWKIVVADTPQSAARDHSAAEIHDNVNCPE